MRKATVHRRRFTVIELVVVIILLGILAVTTVVGTGGLVKHSKLVGQVQQIKAHLRHIQALSMRQDPNTYGIDFSSDSYTLYAVDANGDPIDETFPFENRSTVNLPDGVTVTQGAGTTVTFNKWGSPVDNNGTPLDNNIDLTLSNNSDSRTITVTRETGFIP